MSYKKIVVIIAAIIILVPKQVFGMHIAEGYLPVKWSIIWFVLFIPFLILGFRHILKIYDREPKAKLLFAVVGAFVFVLSSLKLPSVGGSSSHLTGIALGAILFGASTMSIIGLIVLLFQALLLAHGGLTTLGANSFSMAIVGAFSAVWVFKLCKGLNMKRNLAIFIAAFVSDICIYICTSSQLALAFQSENIGILENFVKFVSVFAVTQLPLALVEGILTVMVFNIINKYSNNEIATINPSLNY